MLFLLLMMLPIFLVFPFVLAIYAGFKWRGGWRVAAMVPLAVLVLFFGPMFRDWSRDPTAHNLWPLVFIPIALLLCIYTIVLLVLYYWRLRRPQQK